MSLTDQVFSQARFLAQDLTQDNLAVLEAVCKATVASLEARLRDNLTAKDCLSDFVTAAGMYAVAAMYEIGDFSQVEQLTAGDLTLRKRDAKGPAALLRSQAEQMMAPHLRPGFSFVGV